MLGSIDVCERHAILLNPIKYQKSISNLLFLKCVYMFMTLMSEVINNPVEGKGM